MREFTIGKNDAGQRLDRFVARNLPLLPPALLQKYIRLKRIKVNGKGSKRDTRLCVGDILQLYINDEFFAPALCNRIDRNTGGIVIAAKNAETLRIINEKIKNHELEKSYLCVTVGRPRPAEGRVEGFLRKDEAKKEVTFFDHPIPGGKTAVTLYRTLESRGELSLVECRLLTGRTHQIRVSMAHLGCPLLGDGKYGRGDVNRRYGETRQALYSYKLRFAFSSPAGLLDYLQNRTFCVEAVPFRDKYFSAP